MYRSVITVPNLKNSISKNRSISEFVFGRWYHTKKGVFGYQPKREEPLVGMLQILIFFCDYNLHITII